MGDLMLLHNEELIDAIFSVVPDVDESDVQILAEKLRYPLSLLNAAGESVKDSSLLTEALGELMRRISGGMEGVASIG